MQALEQKAQAQRQRIVDKCGDEFLVLIAQPNTKVTVTDIVQKLVVQDEEGNVISPDWCFISGQGYSGEV